MKLRWALSDVPTVREAQREEGPGRCLGCGARLQYAGVGRHPLVCRELECVRLYHQLYAWHRREKSAAAVESKPGGGNTPPATVTSTTRRG